MSKSSTIRF